jgi:PPM family protein phosphatase
MDTSQNPANQQQKIDPDQHPTAPLSQLADQPDPPPANDPPDTAATSAHDDAPPPADGEAAPAAGSTAATPSDSECEPEMPGEPWWAEASSPEADNPAPEAPADPADPAVPEPDSAIVDTSPAEPAYEGTRQLSADQVPAEAPHSSSRGLAFSALRDIGQTRKINQDSVYAMLTTLPREDGDQMMGLFIVADGMGGHEGGEIASRLAIRTVAQQILANLVLPSFDNQELESLQEVMIGAVEEANRVIWEQARLNQTDMGTTCTAVLMLGKALFAAHVGDSRAYTLEYGHLEQITSDHSAVGRLIELGQLAPSEAHEHPLRNQLYRTIGQQAEVEVDFTYQKVGDATHLLLCSDGLWGMLRDEAMCRTIIDSSWPQEACRELIAQANLAGGDDNISAIVVLLPSAERRKP